ncbi:MAG: ATP-binding protein [Nonlabens sp.]
MISKFIHYRVSFTTFLIMVFSCCISWSIAQNLDYNKYQSLQTFNSQDGLEVYNVQSVEFDNEGWLWIAGTEINLNNTFNENKPILQRYNGHSFYTVGLPEIKEITKTKLSLVKRQDGQLYLEISTTATVNLYLVNPETLEIKLIDLPNESAIDELFIFPFQDRSMVLLRSGMEMKAFYLSEQPQEFRELPNKLITSKDPSKIAHPTILIDLGDAFIIPDNRSGIYLYNSNGRARREITPMELGLEPLDGGLDIVTWFSREGRTFVLFNYSMFYYEYLPASDSWQKTEILKSKSNGHKYLLDQEKVCSDRFGNLVRRKVTTAGQQYSFFLNGTTKQQDIFIPLLDNFKIASRDLKKELVLVARGELYHFHFQSQDVVNFLVNKSLRALLEINENELLVATESSGWYVVNTITGKEQEFPLFLNGKPYIATSSHKIFNSKDYYWSNDKNGIIKVDKKNGNVTSFIDYPIEDMVEDDHYIYYGTVSQNLMKFDKIKEENLIITPTRDFKVQGILKREGIIYLTTDKGLLIYSSGGLRLFEIENPEETSFFIALSFHDQLGLLVGSSLGKVYQFNPKEGSFLKIYDDPLGASIATLMADSLDNLWINTFNGFVKFDPSGNKHLRFSSSDGFSFYEANRYSSLLTNSGNIALGTLKGLNYFNPEELKNAEVDATLKLSSLNYFDTSTGSQLIETAPAILEDIKTITLPAKNRSLQIEFGLIGIYDVDKINYRYRIDGKSWVDLKQENEIKLFSLAAGSYDLEISAMDSIHNMISRPLTLNIVVDDFFYNSPWFYLLLLLLLFIIGIWFYREKQKKFLLKEEFARQIINSQELDRTRIAKDLHDNIGQRLLLIKNDLLSKENEQIDLRLIEETIKEVRGISHDLHPFQFVNQGLIKSLENLMDEFQRSSKIFYSHDIEDVSGFIKKEHELFLFRIIQECVTNVEKHSQATACVLLITQYGNTVQLILRDNGKGFNQTRAKNVESGLGIRSIRERAQYINAIFDIESSLEKGTQITLQIEVNAHFNHSGR